MIKVKRADVYKAILNWQNTVGGAHNGQLEAFLGVTLAFIDMPYVQYIELEDQAAERIKTLLNENHKTMIKIWFARMD